MMQPAKQALFAELKELERARDVLLYSYDKCSQVRIGPNLDPEQLESLEALTSRFARLSDIIILRIFRYLDTIDLEESGTARDRVNRAEKKGALFSQLTSSSKFGCFAKKSRMNIRLRLYTRSLNGWSPSPLFSWTV